MNNQALCGALDLSSDFVCQIDDIVGKITKELEQAGLAGNTREEYGAPVHAF